MPSCSYRVSLFWHFLLAQYFAKYITVSTLTEKPESTKEVQTTLSNRLSAASQSNQYQTPGRALGRGHGMTEQQTTDVIPGLAFFLLNRRVCIMQGAQYSSPHLLLYHTHGESLPTRSATVCQKKRQTGGEGGGQQHCCIGGCV